MRGERSTTKDVEWNGIKKNFDGLKDWLIDWSNHKQKHYETQYEYKDENIRE